MSARKQFVLSLQSAALAAWDAAQAETGIEKVRLEAFADFLLAERRTQEHKVN